MAIMEKHTYTSVFTERVRSLLLHSLSIRYSPNLNLWLSAPRGRVSRLDPCDEHSR